MKNLEKQLEKIKKSYFSFADARKVADMDDASLRVAVSRLVRGEKITKLTKGYYSLHNVVADLQKMALEIYAPSYLSFEWALGQYNVLSQKSYALTLATTKRAKKIEVGNTRFIYRHIKKDVFWGYVLKDGYLVAEPEKAFLDLAYLSLNGYAKFDAEEMNLNLLDIKKIEEFLKKFSNSKLEKLVRRFL